MVFGGWLRVLLIVASFVGVCCVVLVVVVCVCVVVCLVRCLLFCVRCAFFL